MTIKQQNNKNNNKIIGDDINVINIWYWMKKRGILFKEIVLYDFKLGKKIYKWLITKLSLTMLLSLFHILEWKNCTIYGNQNNLK